MEVMRFTEKTNRVARPLTLEGRKEGNETNHNDSGRAVDVVSLVNSRITVFSRCSMRRDALVQVAPPCIRYRIIRTATDTRLATRRTERLATEGETGKR